MRSRNRTCESCGVTREQGRAVAPGAGQKGGRKMRLLVSNCTYFAV